MGVGAHAAEKAVFMTLAGVSGAVSSAGILGAVLLGHGKSNFRRQHFLGLPPLEFTKSHWRFGQLAGGVVSYLMWKGVNESFAKDHQLSYAHAAQLFGHGLGLALLPFPADVKRNGRWIIGAAIGSALMHARIFGIKSSDPLSWRDLAQKIAGQPDVSHQVSALTSGIKRCAQIADRILPHSARRLSSAYKQPVNGDLYGDL